MPTLLFINGLRFFFYSNENNEPPHVHIIKAGSFGKIWLEPVIEVVYLNGFTRNEIKDILQIVHVNCIVFKNKWNEHFSK